MQHRKSIWHVKTLLQNLLGYCHDSECEWVEYNPKSTLWVQKYEYAQDKDDENWESRGQSAISEFTWKMAVKMGVRA